MKSEVILNASSLDVNVVKCIQPIFKNQPNEICSHLSEKASKGPISSKGAVMKQKKRRKRRGRRKKGGEGKKAMVAVLVFTMIGTLRSEDGDCGENVAEKVNSRFFNLDRD